MNYNILVVEDDKVIASLVKTYLESSGHFVFMAFNGEEAMEIFRENDINCIVLDIILPDTDGYEITKKIRKQSDVPIIFLSGQKELTDKIYGLSLGADDYIVKPFEPLELIARVNSNLRRYYVMKNSESDSEKNQTIRQGRLTLNLTDVRLQRDEEEIPITITEYKILLKMMKSPGRVFSKAQLYEGINGEFFANDENTIMVHISNLRGKIEDDVQNPQYIKTVRGMGYKFEKQD